MTNTPPKISLYKFKFVLQAIENMKLPAYKGSMFRGAFGWAFKRAVCVTRQPTCNNCLLQEHCGYFKVFETEMPENNIPFFNGVKKVPHPFLIEPPLDEKREFNEGDILEVGLTLFGYAVKFFPFYVFTFQQMGKTGVGYRRDKFKLLSVINYDSHGAEEVIYTEDNGKLKTNYHEIKETDILADANNNISKITLDFITPFRIQHEGRIIKDSSKLNTQILLSALQRRVISISRLFCDDDSVQLNEFDDIKIEIAQNTLVYKLLERYSNRQKRKMDIGGFVGKITLTGNIKEIIPLLYLSRELNIGKNTAFGLGKFNVLLS